MRILSVPMPPQAQQTFAAGRQTGLSRPASSEPVLRSSEPLFGGGLLSLMDKNWNEAKVKRLLNKSGANLEKLDSNGDTPLIWACESGHTKLAKKLLAKNVNVHFISDNDETAQHVAAKNGHKQVLKALEKHGANLNLQNREGYTALHLAATKGNTDVVRFLLDKGANQDLTTNANKTTAMLAQEHGYTHIVNLLEEHKQAAIRKVAAEEAKQKELAAQKAAKENAKNFSSKMLMAAVKDGDTDGIHQHLTGQNQNGNGCLALFIRKTPLVNRMLEGKTPLMVAAEQGHIDAMHMLIRYGADLNQQGENKRTALGSAAQKGSLPIVRELLACGAGVSSQDLRDLLTYIPPENPPTLEKSGMSRLSRAAAEESADEIRRQAIKSVRPTETQQSGVLDEPDQQGLTPLMQAAKYGKIDAARMLLDYGADISKPDAHGETALSHAARHKQNNVVRFLLDRGAGVTPNDLSLLLGKTEETFEDTSETFSPKHTGGIIIEEITESAPRLTGPVRLALPAPPVMKSASKKEGLELEPSKFTLPASFAFEPTKGKALEESEPPSGPEPSAPPLVSFPLSPPWGSPREILPD